MWFALIVTSTRQLGSQPLFLPYFDTKHFPEPVNKQLPILGKNIIMPV
jgi:hypothetical protein